MTVRSSAVMYQTDFDLPRGGAGHKEQRVFVFISQIDAQVAPLGQCMSDAKGLPRE